MRRLQIVQTTAFPVDTECRRHRGPDHHAHGRLLLLADGRLLHAEDRIGASCSKRSRSLRKAAASSSSASTRASRSTLAAARLTGCSRKDGTRLAGDVSRLPQPLPPPDRAAEVTVDWIRQSGRIEPLEVRAVSVPLPDGSTLFLGRATSDLREIEEIVTRAMAMAVVPAAVLALVGGALVSLATLRRVEAVRRACSLIMEGQFHPPAPRTPQPRRIRPIVRAGQPDARRDRADS